MERSVNYLQGLKNLPTQGTKSDQIGEKGPQFGGLHLAFMPPYIVVPALPGFPPGKGVPARGQNFAVSDPGRVFVHRSGGHFMP